MPIEHIRWINIIVQYPEVNIHGYTIDDVDDIQVTDLGCISVKLGQGTLRYNNIPSQLSFSEQS